MGIIFNDNSHKKRIIIVLVYLLIIASLIASLYFWLKPEESCSDGIKNQNEENVDCGGICAKRCEKIVIEDLVVEQGGFLENGIAGRVDLYGKIYNPNSIFGGSQVQYEFRAKDEQGQVIFSKKGMSFVLPGESKYVVENNIEAPNNPSSVELAIVGVQWVEFNDQYEKPQIKVVNKQYNQINTGIGFSEAVGLLKNESPFDFSVIKIIIILRDYSDKIVALNSTEIRTVRSGENRDFKTLWTSRFHGDVSNVEVQAEVDIFSSEAYTRKFFSPENIPASDYR